MWPTTLRHSGSSSTTSTRSPDGKGGPGTAGSALSALSSAAGPFCCSGSVFTTSMFLLCKLPDRAVGSSTHRTACTRGTQRPRAAAQRVPEPPEEQDRQPTNSGTSPRNATLMRTVLIISHKNLQQAQCCTSKQPAEARTCRCGPPSRKMSVVCRCPI